MSAPLLALLVLAAGPNPHLGAARTAYQGMEFEKCLRKLEQAGSRPSSPREITEIELYSGLCAASVSKWPQAGVHFRRALELEPELKLPPGTSPKIAEFFAPLSAEAAAREAARAPPPPPPLAPPKDAPRAVALAPAPTAPPAVELKPAPVPQLRPLPLVFGGVALLAAGTGSYLGLQARAQQAQAARATYASDAFVATGQASRNAQWANVTYAVAATSAVGAAISYFAGGGFTTVR
jgi:hypothetical protein